MKQLNILKNAQDKYDFYETEDIHANHIYANYNPKHIMRVIDICSGLGSLIKPWYDNGHSITLIELNEDFIPILQLNFPTARILKEDYLSFNDNEEYDVYLCNPPFNDKNEKIYPSFFCKIIQTLNQSAVCYFICPRMFYTNQMLLKIENEYNNQFELISYIKENKTMPPKYYFDRYGYIQLYSTEFRFNKNMINKMIDKKIIDIDFLTYDEDDKLFIINPYFEFQYLGNIFDFKMTKCRCGLFKIIR